MKVWLAILLTVAMLLVACNVLGTVQPASSGLRIITEAYPPYNFVDKNNNVTGQSTEIVQAILKRTGTQAAIEVMPLSEGLALAQKGPNIVIYSLNRTPQREGLFKWVGPIGNYEQAFYAKKGSTIVLNKLEDAKNVKKIGVYKGDAGAQFLAAQGFANLDESLTDAEALKKLMDGTVQLWLGNKEGLAITAEQAGVSTDDLIMLPSVVIRADLYIAFSKDIPDSTVKAWQSALDDLKQERDIDYKTVYEKIQAKYSDPEYIESLLHE
ncbi:MAG: amino acid ABC transporter substrate-binding protein [Chloroflexi bacterium]|nr:amino acid ABC transporter substrate-binding protein [Chloroflexota bacterium]